MYVSDTARSLDGDTHDIIAFDVTVDGSLSGRRLFQSVEPGIPDGFVVDKRGWVWTTSKAGMQIFAANGAKLGLIPTPRAGCFWLELRRDSRIGWNSDSTCWLGGGQQECRSHIRKTCATG